MGLAVVGWLHSDARSPQFLGDVGNVAAKLEQQTKELGCTLLVSSDTWAAISPELANALPVALVPIPGKQEPLATALFKTRDALQSALAVAPAAP